METWGVIRTGTTLVTALGLAVIMAGCSTTAPSAEATPTATASARPTPTSTPADQASPLPTEEPVAAPAATCDTALAPAEYAQFDADGLTAREDSANANLDELAETGGITCLWRKPSTDIEAWYAQWPSDEATWDALSAEILANGGSESTDTYAGVMQPEYNAALTYRDGTVYYASPPRLFSSVLGLQ